MKRLLTLALFGMTSMAIGQDFNKNISTAKASYASGDLENSRFAMQQALNDIDLLVGKEMLKILPAKLETLNSNVKSDNVTVNTGFSGVVVHRDYGTDAKRVNLDIISNSPLVASINAILSIPFVGNSSDGTQKVIKIQGYKAVMQKNVNAETNTAEFTVQIPVNSTLITLTVPNSTEAEITRFANLIPVAQIAKMVQ